jgi:pimeloyl-ACP methyl ester carboxylesterase
MKTQLIEFPNNEGVYLRGILLLPDSEVLSTVICLHGFERCSTTEKKFKALSDDLVEKDTAVLRLDFSGCGLSDGDFRFTTVERQAEDLLEAVRKLKNNIGDLKINFVVHSLGACVLATKIGELSDQIGKIVLIAPALNQKELLRYWFVTSKMKKSNSEVEITWHNYRQYLDEDAFLKDSSRNNRMTKLNYIEAKYFLENKDVDFSDRFQDLNSRILHVHGLKDKAVPIESLSLNFDNQIIIENGDHDLERPDQFEQWKDEAVDFLTK